MQDTPQPTDQQREEFREFLSEVIATLRTAQELTRRIPTPEYFDGEGMAYADPIIAEQKARIDTTVRMLDELRGDFSREWLHAYMERKRANARQKKYLLFFNLSGEECAIKEVGGKKILVVFSSFDQVARTDTFRQQVLAQCPDQATSIIHFFDHCGIQALQSYLIEI